MTTLTRRRGRVAAACVVVSLAATGCGSTVQVQSSSREQQTFDGLGAPTGGPDASVATDAGSLPTPGAGLGATSPGSGPRLGGQGTTGSATGGTTGGTTGVSLGPGTGRGFTRTTIDIGFPESDDPSPFIAALGIEGVAGGDPKAQILAVVNDINRRGGLVGRKINPVFHMFSTAQQLSDPGTANEAACVDWTQDHKVFAVLYPGALIQDEGLFACMAKTNTPLILGGGQDSPAFPRTTYAKYPYLFNVAGMHREQYLDIAIRRYVERKFFSPWDTVNGRPGTAPVKIGLFYKESALGQVDVRYIRAQLAKYGLKPATQIGCSASLQESIQCQQSGVLRMQSDGVTHIIGAGLSFMNQADSQRYRPRYIIPIQPKTLEDNAPKTQLAGSMYESWIPALDTSQSQSPGDPSPATAYCKKVMKAAGQDVSVYGIALWQMELLCDVGYFLEAAVKANPVLTPVGLRAGFEALGSSVHSALTFASLLAPGKHASANAVRDLEFRNNCECFAYVSRQNYTR